VLLPSVACRLMSAVKCVHHISLAYSTCTLPIQFLSLLFKNCNDPAIPIAKWPTEKYGSTFSYPRNNLSAFMTTNTFLRYLHIHVMVVTVII
jgi:hypothetical protein